jgi:hypothetical protein
MRNGGPFPGCAADHPHPPSVEVKNVCSYIFPLPHITVAARSKTWVCRRWLAGIVGLNPARSMDDCLLCLVCVVR